MKKVFAFAALILSLASCTKSKVDPNQPVWVYQFTYKRYVVLNNGDTVQGIRIKPDQFGNPIKELVSDNGQRPSAQGWTPIELNQQQLENVQYNLGGENSAMTSTWKSNYYQDSTLAFMMNYGDPNHDGYVIDPAYADLTPKDIASIVEVYEPAILIEHTTYKLSGRGSGTRIPEEMYSKRK